MGTRSMTYVLNERDQCIAAIYRQFDGYPEGMGYDLYNILYGRTLCNGFRSPEDWQDRSNGMEDLAAFMVNRLKQDSLIGNVYLYAPPSIAACEPTFRLMRALYKDARSTWADYFYVIRASKDVPSALHITVGAVGSKDWELLYEGSPEGMDAAFGYKPPRSNDALAAEPQA